MALLLMGQAGVSVRAESPVSRVSVGIEPFYLYTNEIRADLSFDDGTGSLECVVKGATGASITSGEVVLQRKSSSGTYTTVKTWDGLSSSSSTLSFSKTYYVTTGYTYRLKFTATVSKDGGSETVSVTSSAYAG